ncbi:MAG TPA: maleylpyruvate isomerase family mycothiol-dependent enzyme [Micromonosporaceae bacterium]|nr:maleylpyruvate isomerase family mycothiol-dependent enzyme [Micromonosporaceae bacterium]
MRVFDMLVDERRQMANLLESLTADQLAQPSLCTEWTVHDVAAHLVTYLRFGQAKIYFGIVAYAADFDRLNVMLTRRAARRPSHEIIALLRRRAGARTTIPRSGYDPVLTDILLHDLDIRIPLGIQRDTPEERLRVAFHHLAVEPSPGYRMLSRLAGLRLQATDTGWVHGVGPLVRGPADTLLLGMGGRVVAIDQLDGDGVPLLRARVTTAPPLRPLQRLMLPLNVLLRPPPPDRRSRRAVEPTRPG